MLLPVQRLLIATPVPILAAIDWRPGFHDNDFSGWLVTAGYVGSVVACFLAAARCRQNPALPSEFARVWRGLGIVLLLLGLNQQLDLHDLLIEVGRAAAQTEGWYEQRRLVQRVFGAVVVLGLLLATAWALWRWSRFFRRHKLTTVGLAILMGWLVLRVALIEHVGKRTALGWHVEAWRDYLELGSLVLVAVGIWRTDLSRTNSIQPRTDTTRA
jgi:hypothetical protein